MVVERSLIVIERKYALKNIMIGVSYILRSLEVHMLDVLWG
jgi:hypothetical protein